MTQQLLARYAAPVPRYTSYPTAPHFSPNIGAARYADWLGQLAPGSTLSLYLHIPFCDTLCWFCGCHTKITRKHAPVAAYLGALKREIDTIASLIPEGCRVGHVHWGGGSPTILPADGIRDLGGHLKARFSWQDEAEFAVEIDPRGIEAEQIAALAEAGLTRASIGVQDFDPQVQRAINRVQTFEETDRVVAALRGHGVASLNLDLIYGLPHQSVAGIAETVSRALTLTPDRLALFGYAHVPWMKKHQQMISASALPDAAARFAQAETAAGVIAQAGFARIGLDHFARPGDAMAIAAANGTLRRNFQGYTTDAADALIGLGASSIGELPQGYVQNEPAIATYMRSVLSGALASVRGFALREDDRLRKAVIERLMCDLAIDWQALRREHGACIDTLIPARDRLEQLEGDGLIVCDADRLAVTESGRPFLRVVASLFDAYLQQGAARHSLAV